MEIEFYIGDKVEHIDNLPHKTSGSVSGVREDEIFVNWFDGYGEWEAASEIKFSRFNQ
tara:strand:+ start:1642 stop:1815 length:174 start_codon:yes stop_codon:yes gene_type:complete